MDTIRQFLNPGWVSSAIGIVSLLVALMIYRASIVGARPTYQRRALRLIGRDEAVLPNEIEIRFKGQTVDRLTKTYIVFWNSGKALLRGADIVQEDPLRREFSEGSRVLAARISKNSRVANKFALDNQAEFPHKLMIAFDYLDPGDGAVIEVLHTDTKRYPEIVGTVKGVPKGCMDWGRLRPISAVLPFPFNRSRRVLFAVLAFGLLTCVASFLIPESALRSSVQPKYPLWSFRELLIITGVLYAGLPLAMLWFTRRRFPRGSTYSGTR